MESHGKAPLVLGSRGSALALKQVDLVTEALEEGGCDGRPIHVEIISTTGDRRQDLRLASPDLDKAVFTKELEEALHAKQIHVAIHSLKDVPTQLEEEFAICAVLPRAPIEDVLITREAAWCEEGLRSLPSGAVVGTSSLRRSFQLQAIRPDVVVKEIRGNVPTRLAKVADADGEGFDATLLARAGLERLGFSTEGSSLVLESGEVVGLSRIPVTEILPAASQGAVAMEVRSEDVESQEIFRRINHGETWRRIRAERAFLAALGAGCQTPVGIVTREEGDRMIASAIVFDEQGGNSRRGEVEGSSVDAESLAESLVKALN